MTFDPLKTPHTDEDWENFRWNQKIQRFADLRNLREACTELGEPFSEIVEEMKQLKKELKG